MTANIDILHILEDIMAQLSGTQKKQQKTFVVLLVAIVVVLAAIAYIAYGELTAHSSLFEDQKFAEAIAKDLGKAPAFLKESDLAAVKYLGVSYDGSETVTVATGDDKFVDTYNEYVTKSEAGEDVSSYDFTKLVKTTTYTFKSEEAPVIDDLKLFTGVRNIDIAGIHVTDSSVFAGMTGFETASFMSCGLTEVAGFAGIDTEKLVKLTLTGNNIEDWSPLDAVADKVIVSSGYTFTPSEDGTVDFNNMTYTETTLTEHYAKKAQEEANAADNTDETDANTDTADDTADNADAPADNAEDAADNADNTADNTDVPADGAADEDTAG